LEYMVLKLVNNMNKGSFYGENHLTISREYDYNLKNDSGASQGIIGNRVRFSDGPTTVMLSCYHTTPFQRGKG
jgi:hypothetical protein